MFDLNTDGTTVANIKMLSKRWFRFGLPLGSAVVIAALLDMTIGVYWSLFDIGSSIFFHWGNNRLPVEAQTIVNIVLICARLILAMSLWIFVLCKQRAVLLFWIPLSVITDIIFIGCAIFRHPRDVVSDELWIVNVFSLFIFRVYVTCIIFQTLKRLVRNSQVKSHPVITVTSPPGENGEATSTKYYLVEPIGKSPWKIWQYYDNNPRLGAAVIVVFEIFWNIFALCTHKLTEFILGGHLFFVQREEEIVMRFWRIIIDIVALIFILKKRKTLLRFWLIIYFWTLFVSIGLILWSVVEWTFQTPLVVALVICWNSMSDMILRFLVLYFCLMLSLQSSLTVSRTHSLRSETRSIRHSIAVPNASHNHALTERAILAGNQFLNT